MLVCFVEGFPRNNTGLETAVTQHIKRICDEHHHNKKTEIVAWRTAFAALVDNLLQQVGFLGQYQGWYVIVAPEIEVGEKINAILINVRFSKSLVSIKLEAANQIKRSSLLTCRRAGKMSRNFYRLVRAQRILFRYCRFESLRFINSSD